MWNSLLVPERLRNGMMEGQSTHRLVGELGIQTHHVRPLELGDEGESVANRGKQDVAARFVRLGFESDAQAESTIADVRTEEVDGLFVPVQRRGHVLRSVGLDALPATPEDKDLGAELGTEIDSGDRLLHSEAADLWVVGRESPLLEDRTPEEVGRRHRHSHAGGVEHFTEPLHDGFPLGRRGTVGNEVVVVETDAVGTKVGQTAHRLRGIERSTDLGPEGISPGFPTVHNPKVNWCSGRGVKGSAMVRRPH